MIAALVADLLPIPNPVDAAKDAAGAVIGAAASAASDTFLAPIGHAIAKGLASAAKKISDELLHFITNSATVNFRQGWWAGDRAQTLVREIGTLALVLTLLFLLLALIQGLMAGDAGAMVKATLLQVPITIFATVALVAVTELLLGLVDGASAMVLSGVPEALGHFFDGFGTAATIESGGWAALLMVGVFILGAILVWIELVVRSSLIYLLVAAAPLLLAARVWPAARGAWKRLVELGIALIVSKFVIALALGLGAAALAGGGPVSGDSGAKAGLGLAGLMTGAALMLLAAFSPFVVLRLLPIAEAAIVAQGISRMPARAAQTGMQASYYGQGLARMGAARAASGGGGGPGAGGGAGGGGGGGSGGGGSGGGDPSATPAPAGGGGPAPTSTSRGGSTPAGSGGGGGGIAATPTLSGTAAVTAPIPVGAMTVAAAATKAAKSTAEGASSVPTGSGGSS